MRSRKHSFPTTFPFTKARLVQEAKRLRDLGIPQLQYCCEAEKGLHARVYKSELITLYSRYSLHNVPNRILLGELGLITLEQARQRHRAIRLQASRGEDPKAPALGNLTFSALHEDHYLVQCRSRNKKTLHTDLSRYKHWIGPAFGLKRVADITKTDVNRFVLHMQEAGLAPATIRTTLGQLRTTLELAVDLDLIPKNPTKGVRLPRVNNRRTDYLTVAQVQAFLVACRSDANIAGSRKFMLMALTGARIGETIAAKWEDVDLDRGVWTLPDQKSGRPGEILLSAAAMSVIRDMLSVRCNEYVFPGKRANGQSGRGVRVFRRLCKVAGIPDRFRPHDLRHGWVSAGVNAGIPIEIMSQGARHSSPVVTRVYSHVELERLRAANETIADLFTSAKVA